MDTLDTLVIDTPTTLAIAIMALWLGFQINRQVPVLARYNIPVAVSGGIPISLLVAMLELGSGLELRFDLLLRDLLLITFFSTIGLSAKLGQMLAGGKALLLMLGLAVIFLLFQNLLGTGLAYVLDENPLYGLVGGSISLAGGHGTALTWGQLFEDYFGLENASTLGLTFATAGLISGGLVGGPVAAYLIRRHGLTPAEQDQSLPHVDVGQQKTYLINLDDMVKATFLIALCFGIGATVYDWLSDQGMRLPAFLTAMFMGIVLTNLADILKVPVDARPVQLVGDLSLQLFLGMSLISLPLLSLQGALGGISLVILAQALLIAGFAIWVVFPGLGRDYDAACISAGFIGMGLGATPVGIANMNAITSRFGPSAKAYLVIPLLGAFFIDIANATLVQVLLGLPLFGGN